jgi:hypothetical protein
MAAERYAGPNLMGLEQALRVLEKSNDDSRIRDGLGRRRHLVVDVQSGEPVPCYVYRLECGHLVSIWRVPLPPTIRVLYCQEGPPCTKTVMEGDSQRIVGRDRLIVELFAPDGLTSGHD